MNDKRELVATRRIRIQRHDRCLCQWHCLCSCIGSIHGLKCMPMSVDHYHAAGFQGSLPVITSSSEPLEGTYLWHLYNVLLVCLAFLMNILLLGLIKAFIGLCCCSVVGSWGVWLLFPSKSRNLKLYLEPNLLDIVVKRDEAGYAVHPVNCTRNVRILSASTEFGTNLLFFAAAPVAIVIKLLQFCCPCLEPGCIVESSMKSSAGESSVEGGTKEEEMKKEVRKKGAEVSETDTDWSLPSDLEFDEVANDTEFVMQERNESKKTLEENKVDVRSRGGADSPTTAFVFDCIKDTLDSAKYHRENLSELEKEMAEHLVDTLQEAYVVYRNLKNPVGGVSLQPGLPYCVRGYFLKTGCTYQFSLPPPVFQYWDADNKAIIPPLTLESTDFESLYITSEDVLLANELSLLPRGLVINVWHSLEPSP